MSGLRVGYRYAGTAELGKFAAVKVDSATYADGFVATAAQNDVVLGICEKGVLPEGETGYSGGQYTGVTGTAWPSDAVPSSPKGVSRTLLLGYDRIPYVADGAVNRGDRLIAAATSGRLASVVTLALAGGASINVVGIADDDVAGAGDIGHLIVNIHHDTV